MYTSILSFYTRTSAKPTMLLPSLLSFISLFLFVTFASVQSLLNVPSLDFSLPSDMAKEAASTLARFEDRARSDDCYKEPVMLLKKQCKDMDSEGKSRLALKLANCQLVQNGKSPFPCPEDKPLGDCTKLFSSYLCLS